MDYINLYFHVHAKYEDEFKRAFIKVLTESSKEEGCTYIHGYEEREDLWSQLWSARLEFMVYRAERYRLVIEIPEIFWVGHWVCFPPAAL